jgi:hypothetical protein
MFIFGNLDKCSSAFIYLYMAYKPESRHGMAWHLFLLYFTILFPLYLPDKDPDSDPDTYPRIPDPYEKEVQNR